jgi:hypothetical protein
LPPRHPVYNAKRPDSLPVSRTYSHQLRRHRLSQNGRLWNNLLNYWGYRSPPTDCLGPTSVSRWPRSIASPAWVGAPGRTARDWCPPSRTKRSDYSPPKNKAARLYAYAAHNATARLTEIVRRDKDNIGLRGIILPLVLARI